MDHFIDIDGHEILTISEMYAADAGAVAAGVPSLALMEAAGMHCAREIRQRFSRCRTAILCGPGNNGGDGFLIADQAKKRGLPVVAYQLGDVGKIRGDALAAREQALANVVAFIGIVVGCPAVEVRAAQPMV